MPEPTSLAEEFNIPEAVLKQAAQMAYDLLTADQLDDAVVLARGLVAADEGNWYYRSLLGTALYRKRELKSALEIVDDGLKFQPGQEDLTALRRSIATALGQSP